MRPFIYALVDPREPSHYRYIGMSSRKRRPIEHGEIVKRRRGSLRRSQQWIRGLHNKNLDYKIIILEYLPIETPRKVLVAAEHEAMRRTIANGHQITNYSQKWFNNQVQANYKISSTDESFLKFSTIGPHPTCKFITRWGLPCTQKVPIDGEKCHHHKQSKTSRIYIGMKIYHPKFGSGIVASVNSYLKEPTIIVNFEKSGYKKLLIQKLTD